MPTEDSAIAASPLLFRRHNLVVDRDPQALAERLARHYTVCDFAPRQGFERHFLHRATTLAAGDLLLTGGCTTPVQGEIGASPGVGAINLCLAGSASYQIDGLNLEIGAHRPMYFAPGQDYRFVSDHYNGAVFHVDLNRLQQTAAAIAGMGVSRRRFAHELEAPRTVSAQEPRSAVYLRILRRCFTLLDEPELDLSGEFHHLQVDDLIYRTLALLLCPRLEQLIADQSNPANIGREQIFEELLDWIESHITEPINLTALEQRSGYSRRNLQLAFHQRFGCGPIQWVRQRRLEKARQYLLDPQPGDSVRAVSARFGYSSVAVFSRDFRAAFGQRPSDLLREGRRYAP